MNIKWNIKLPNGKVKFNQRLGKEPSWFEKLIYFFISSKGTVDLSNDKPWERL